MDALKTFIEDQFDVWAGGIELSAEPPPIDMIDHGTAESFMASLDPIMGLVRVGPGATLTFGTPRSGEKKKGPYELFSVTGSGKPQLHRRYIYLIASYQMLGRGLGWPPQRVRIYEGPFALVAYSQSDRPYLVSDSRDTTEQMAQFIEHLRDPQSAPKGDRRVTSLLDGLVRGQPKLFWARGPGFDATFEMSFEDGNASFQEISAMPSWAELSNP